MLLHVAHAGFLSLAKIKSSRICSVERVKYVARFSYHIPINAKHLLLEENFIFFLEA